MELYCSFTLSYSFQWEQEDVPETGDAALEDEGEEAAGGWRHDDDVDGNEEQDEEQENGDKEENVTDEASIHYTKQVSQMSQKSQLII